MASSSFKDFTREWGSLLVWDGAASLDRLFDAYTHADGSDARPATIEDFTDLWAAAKRANMEWEATCMVRSVRQSVALDTTVTPYHLMTAMTCWAATLHQRVADFFKQCSAQVRDVIDQAAARCSNSAGEAEDGDAAVLNQEIAFCVALELFGWHSSLLTCLRATTAQQPGPMAADDVLLYIRTVAQYLTPRYLPRGFSAESTPHLTTGRTSALSSASEHESHAHKLEAALTTSSPPTACTASPTIVVDYAPSPTHRGPTCEDAAAQHVRFEPTHAVGAAAEPSSPTSPSAPPRSPPLRGPPVTATTSRPTQSPQQAPRSRGTPQCSPKNLSSPTHFADAPPENFTPLPAQRRNSQSTSASHERVRRDEAKEKKKALTLKKAMAKKDGQGCAAF